MGNIPLKQDSPHQKGINAPFRVYLNDRRNEFFYFENESFVIPRISVHGLTFGQKIELTEEIRRLIPEFISSHSVLEHPKPVAETMFIHYVKPVTGKHFNFLHVLKIDLKFSGNPDTIIEKGNNEFYPSYRTNRLYYKSILVPIHTIEYSGNSIVGFDSMKIFDKVNIYSEAGKFTNALFDDVYYGEITEEIVKDLADLQFPFSCKIFPFLYYAYFTACFNLPYPFEKEINEALRYYEPIFVKLSTIHKKDFPVNAAYYKSSFNYDEKHCFSDFFKAECGKYFARFSITYDDDLLLKNWRELNVKMD
jgi:hypothetical protein